MSKAIELKSGRTVGYAALGNRSGVTGSVRQQVHDGDTINVRAVGNFGIRFLGVDAPEISFQFPKTTTFVGMANDKWQEFFKDPFDNKYGEFKPALETGLKDHLKANVKPDTAMNQYQHAVNAEDKLEAEVLSDIKGLKTTEEDFKFFLIFAHEITDRYGRLLCFINRFQSNTKEPKLPLTYNERLLELGMVNPYFIWPNINPFRNQESVIDAVVKPGEASAMVGKEKTLQDAIRWVSDARKNEIGVFAAPNPQRIQPFEVRFLAQRRPPSRWVIDLSKNDNVLIHPQKYYTIPNAEDRLFIPEEYVPLFENKGWKLKK